MAASYIPCGGRVRTDGPRCIGGGAVSVRGWRDHVTAHGRHVRGESRRRSASLCEYRVAMWSSRAEPINTLPAGCWQSQESTKLCTRDYDYDYHHYHHHHYHYHHYHYVAVIIIDDRRRKRTVAFWGSPSSVHTVTMGAS